MDTKTRIVLLLVLALALRCSLAPMPACIFCLPIPFIAMIFFLLSIWSSAGEFS